MVYTKGPHRSVTKICTIPNTSFFLTGSKDGDVKLWDAKWARLVFHWPKLHERHTFLQPTSRGFGGVVRAGVTDIQIVSHGFVSCGGDGSVRLVTVKGT
nr:RAVE (regulator of V-ATPase assembly) complex subunit RAV1/DMX protein, WD repeat superfamily [Ipomoea batatas]GME17247.1 RAVE (regulator of V-ATPase assembly) complex subunit RAV1/DMX protein, WD repeat superfamily [Ipomoea batatas]